MADASAGSFKIGPPMGRVTRKVSPGTMPGAGFTGLGAPRQEGQGWPKSGPRKT